MNTTFRVWLPIALTFLLLFAFGIAVYFVLDRQAEYRKMESDSVDITRYSNRTLSQLKDAETGQRGYILTAENRYLEPFNAAQAELPGTLRMLHDLADPDPLLAEHVRKLDVIVAGKMAELRETIQLRREKGFETAVEVVRTDRGLQYMSDARTVAQEIGDIEKSVQSQTSARQDHLQQLLKLLLLVGGPMIAIISMAGIQLATRRIVNSIRLLEQGFTSVGSGGAAAHIDIQGHDEFSRLATSFNGMSARLGAAAFAQQRAEAQLREKNVDLARHGREMEERTHSLDLLGRVAHRLPGCTTESEFSALVERYIPQLFPEIPGALYLLNASHTLLRCVSKWNDPKASEPEFALDDCWAMRRGQPHINLDLSKEVVCTHMDGNASDAYMCWPLTAQNETVGLLYLEHVPGAPFVLAGRMQDVSVLCETIALAMVNLRLRESLRNQSIRDPLTGLFNRRYLEESLELEFSRAERSNAPVAIIMLDIDHFKQFNDTFGHAAGDLVLKHVSETLGQCIRKGDVPCRYGGEEFLMVLVGATAQAATWRAEQIRTAIKELRLEYNGTQLGTITASLGVAIYPACGTTPAQIIEAADIALYDAKHNGRDQVRQAAELPHAAVKVVANAE